MAKDNVKQNVNEGISSFLVNREKLNAKRSQAKLSPKPAAARNKQTATRKDNPQNKPSVSMTSGYDEPPTKKPPEQSIPEDMPVTDSGDNLQNRQKDSTPTGNPKRIERLTDIRLYSLTEIEDIIGVTHRTLLSYVKNKRFRASKVGGKWRVTEGNLRSFINGEG